MPNVKVARATLGGQLPLALLSAVLEFIAFEEFVGSKTRVCSTWNSVRVRLSRREEGVPLSALKKYAVLRSVQAIKLGKDTRFEDVDNWSFTDVRDLVMEVCPLAGVAGVRLLLEKCPLLTNVRLAGFYTSDIEVLLSAVPNLRMLSLDCSCSQQTCAALIACSSLVELEISPVFIPTDFADALLTLSHLQSLKIGAWWEDPNQVVRLVDNLVHLHTLSLNLSVLTFAIVTSLRKLKLRELRLTTSRCSSDHLDLRDLVGPRMQKLNLFALHDTDKFSLLPYTQDRLTRLSLDNLAFLEQDPTLWQRLCQNLPSLTSVHIYSVSSDYESKAPDAPMHVLEEIVSIHTNSHFMMRHGNFMPTRSLTTQLLFGKSPLELEDGNNYDDLRRLRVTTWARFEMTFTRVFTNLQELVFPSATDAGLQAIVDLSQLQKLTILFETHAVTEEGYKALKSMTALRTLSWCSVKSSDCFYITAMLLQELALACGTATRLAHFVAMPTLLHLTLPTSYRPEIYKLFEKGCIPNALVVSFDTFKRENGCYPKPKADPHHNQSE